MGKYLFQTKVVYLDQKDWIDVGRDYYGHSHRTVDPKISDLIITSSETAKRARYIVIL